MALLNNNNISEIPIGTPLVLSHLVKYNPRKMRLWNTEENRGIINQVKKFPNLAKLDITEFRLDAGTWTDNDDGLGPVHLNNPEDYGYIKVLSKMIPIIKHRVVGNVKFYRINGVDVAHGSYDRFILLEMKDGTFKYYENSGIDSIDLNSLKLVKYIKIRGHNALVDLCEEIMKRNAGTLEKINIRVIGFGNVRPFNISIASSCKKIKEMKTNHLPFLDPMTFPFLKTFKYISSNEEIENKHHSLERFWVIRDTPDDFVGKHYHDLITGEEYYEKLYFGPGQDVEKSRKYLSKAKQLEIFVHYNNSNFFDELNQFFDQVTTTVKEMKIGFASIVEKNDVGNNAYHAYSPIFWDTIKKYQNIFAAQDLHSIIISKPYNFKSKKYESIVIPKEIISKYDVVEEEQFFHLTR